MGENLALFLRYYYRPVRASSDALDNGSIAFAIVVAIAAFVLWTFPGGAPAGDPASLPTGPSLLLSHAVSLATPRSIFPLIALFAGMMPVAIGVVAAWDGLGSAGIVLRREYVPMLVCTLFSWSATYLPAGIAHLIVDAPALAVAGHAGFLILFVVSLRTALGSTTAHAAVAMLAGWIAALGMVALGPFIGGFSYFLLSPWVLYMLFRYYSPDVRSLGESMNSRRSFRRQLEASMINPRDADAHFQLGLIYERRRQYEDAEASFRRAVAIDPQEADAQLHLGRALRAQGRSSEALPHFQAALASDPRVSRQEGWRDLGATLLDLGKPEEACPPLERYIHAREYDPEGLFYYGSALRALGRNAEARQAFEQAIAAVHSAPKYRRGQLRRWTGEAKTALKTMKA